MAPIFTLRRRRWTSISTTDVCSRNSGDAARWFAHYTALIENEESASPRPLTDWLAYNGFTVVTKPAKEFDDGEGRRKFKRSMSVELVIDAFGMAKHIDNIVLFSGDGNFRALVEALQRRGVRVTVVSTLLSKPPMILTNCAARPTSSPILRN